MKRAIVAALVITALSGAACQSPVDPEPTAEVVHSRLPLYSEEDSGFSLEGEVTNVGNAQALWVKVKVCLRRSDGSVLAEQAGYVRKDGRSCADGLAPRESAAWYVSWGDFGRSIRNQVDYRKSRFDISWRDPI